MTHNSDRLAGTAVAFGDDDVVLAGLAAEEVDGVVLLFGLGVVGTKEHVGAVVDADDGVAPVVADVEAVDVVAAENDGLPVHGRALPAFSPGQADHEFLQVDGAFPCLFGALLHALFAVRLDHGDGGEAEYDGEYGIKDLHRSKGFVVRWCIILVFRAVLWEFMQYHPCSYANCGSRW